MAKKLQKYKGKEAVVYALPRGGVVLGYEVAKELGLPLDLVITRKIGHPLMKEYAICAVAEDGEFVCNEAERLLIDKKWLEDAIKKEQEEARRRRLIYLGDRKPIAVIGKDVIIVDDGIATGLTIELAIKEAKHRKPARIIVAVPVAPADVIEKIRKEIDEVIALEVPKIYLGAVGAYYQEFPQLEDEEVIKLIKKLAT